MKKDRAILALIGTYSTILLLSAIIGVTVLSTRLKRSVNTVTETVTEKEIVYVYAENDILPSAPNPSEPDEKIWIVREYRGQIGIFSEDDALVRTINVYIKTLPETDRILLKEGIRVTSERQLYSIIEDYSS